MFIAPASTYGIKPAAAGGGAGIPIINPMRSDQGEPQYTVAMEWRGGVSHSMTRIV